MRKLLILLLLLVPFTAKGQSYSGQSSGTIRVVPPYQICLGPDNGTDFCIIQSGTKTAKVNGDLLDKNGNPFGTGGGGGGATDFSQLTGQALCRQIPSFTGDASTPSGTCITTVNSIQGNGFPGTLAAAHQIYVATSSGTFVLKTLPDCPDSSAGNHLNYTLSTDVFSCGTQDGIIFQVNNTPTTSQTVLNLKAGTNMTLTPDGSGGILLDSTGGSSGACTIPTLVNGDFYTNNGSTCSWTALADAPQAVTDTPGTYMSGYTVIGGAFATRKLSPSSPIFSTTDTLSNTSITTEQLFASNIKIPANTIVANHAILATAVFDTVNTTGANTTLKAYLCPTQGSLTGCLRVYVSTTSTPTANVTQSASLPIVIVGTAAAGATATVISTGGVSSGASSPIGQNRQSSIVANVPTNADLFLQFSVQYAATTAAISITCTALLLNAGPLT